MDRRRSEQGWRAAALAAALFAITLNFLQPLAHAALMRSGAPANWAAMCLPRALQEGDGVGGFGPPQAASSVTAATRATRFDIFRMTHPTR